MKRIIDHLKENWIKYGFETLVITAGILLAFGLNSWNEQRKRKVLEIEHLTNIKQSFISLKNQSVQYATAIPETSEANQSILTAIMNDDPYSDSLAVFFGHIYVCFPWAPDYSAFESLKSAGIEIISNDSLRNRFTQTFGVTLPTLASQQIVHCNLLEKMIATDSPLWTTKLEGPPVDFEKLKKDNSFAWILRSNLDFFESNLEFYIKITPQLEMIIEDIDAEIAHLKGQ